MQRGLRCLHCLKEVPINDTMGVINRNHCPFCLYSLHVDKQAGDRQETCQGLMKPIGLSFKRSPNKYGSDKGELMLIHQCERCKQISINRIAADDQTSLIEKIFEESLNIPSDTLNNLQEQGIQILGKIDQEHIKIQLYGKG